MAPNPKEFIDFWIETSIHPSDLLSGLGATQDADELVRRCIEMAASQGITEAMLHAEIGDLASYIRKKLKNANDAQRKNESF